ncbi:MAG: hypothetical protein HY347_07240 [candidate division NC10 bacterium]|nr:hypothetical protein [candidate division NC10 bacterium]
MGTRLKAEVSYRPAKRKGTMKQCGHCQAFQPELRSCLMVSGEIEPFMVCDLWEPMPFHWDPEGEGVKAQQAEDPMEDDNA